MIFPALLGRVVFLFIKNMIFLFRKKIEGDIPNMIFHVWSVKVIFLFSVNMMILFGHEIKNDFSPRNMLRDCNITIFCNIALDAKLYLRKNFSFGREAVV